MKASFRHRLFTGSVFFLLFLGVVNYILLQPHVLFLRFFPVKAGIYLPFSSAFLTAYFSDMTWCAALYMAVVVLEEMKALKRNSKLFLLSLPFITEAAQGLHLMNGTFDWYDVLLYGLLLLVFSLVFPSLHFYQTAKRELQAWPLVLFTGFLLMAVASASPKYTYKPPKPEPCVTHKGLAYSPILVKINISGSYTMKDLSGAQRFGYQYVMERFEAMNPYKYQLADGVTPNLTLNITVNTDGYQHYGATMYGYVYDGSFNNSWNTDYVTAEKLFDDIASQVDWYIRYGWCKNCPSPCNP